MQTTRISNLAAIPEDRHIAETYARGGTFYWMLKPRIKKRVRVNFLDRLVNMKN
jgi:hypothetical protein